MIKTYYSPWWLPSKHLQTVYPFIFLNRKDESFCRQRVITPDKDFIDFDSMILNKKNPILIIFHGLEGSSNSHYVQALCRKIKKINWNIIAVNFRGCSGEPNLTKRSYHAGDSDEIDWVLRTIKKRFKNFPKYFVVGVSLGGNSVIKLLGERKKSYKKVIDGAVCVSVPYMLNVTGKLLNFGLNKLLYCNHFLKSLKKKIIYKSKYLDLNLDINKIKHIKTIEQFDNLYTAPVHGFNNVYNYWDKSSCLPFMKNIEVDVLLIHSSNDPLFPSQNLINLKGLSSKVKIFITKGGGHVGFVQGPFPGNTKWLPDTIIDFFKNL